MWRFCDGHKEFTRHDDANAEKKNDAERSDSPQLCFSFPSNGPLYQRDQWSLFKVTSTKWTERRRVVTAEQEQRRRSISKVNDMLSGDIGLRAL